MKLYDYFRSSAAYRVRIALNLKGLAAEYIPVHLLRGGGEHLAASYLALNPQGLVPALELDDGSVLTQSLAIIEYLDALYPEPRLIPADLLQAARVRALALAIACDVHPLGNLRVLEYLKTEHRQQEAAIARWRSHWVLSGLEAIERTIAPAPFSFGEHPTLADVCLVPQIFNARRFAIPLDRLPKVCAIEAACNALAAFAAAHPGQSDAE